MYYTLARAGMSASMYTVFLYGGGGHLGISPSDKLALQNPQEHLVFNIYLERHAPQMSLGWP